MSARRFAPFVLLAFAASALAQSHAHGEATPVVLFDLEPTGRAVVGEVTHLGFVLLNAAGWPQVHQDALFRLEQNGKVLFESPHTHEYDGLFAFDWVFAEPGPYAATVEWKDKSATFRGEVVHPAAVVPGAHVDLVAPEAAVAGEPVPFDLAVLDEAGAIVPHSDALVEVWRGERLTLRAHLHTHEERMAFDYAFPAAGAYEVRVVGYVAFPVADQPDVPAVLATRTVTVTPSLPALPLPTAAPDCARDPVAVAAPRAPALDPGHADGAKPTLNVTVDPSAVIGPDTPMRLSGIVLDGRTRAPVQHVNFVGELLGPAGVVFRSSALHEYDGHYELVVVPEQPGSYDWTLAASAKRAGLDATAGTRFCVVPPVAPLAAGPMEVTLSGADAVLAGEPVELQFDVAGPTGPLDHSEVDVEILRADGVPLLVTKLHGHAGRMLATVTFPEAGEYTVRAFAAPLVPTPTPVTNRVFTVDVAPNPAAALDLPQEAALNAAPGAGLLLLAAAAGVAVAARRRV